MKKLISVGALFALLISTALFTTSANAAAPAAAIFIGSWVMNDKVVIDSVDQGGSSQSENWSPTGSPFYKLTSDHGLAFARAYNGWRTDGYKFQFSDSTQNVPCARTLYSNDVQTAYNANYMGEIDKAKPFNETASFGPTQIILEPWATYERHSTARCYLKVANAVPGWEYTVRIGISVQRATILSPGNIDWLSTAPVSNSSVFVDGKCASTGFVDITIGGETREITPYCSEGLPWIRWSWSASIISSRQVR